MFSAGLAKSAFLQTRRLLDKKDKLRKVLSNINSEMLAMRKECGTEEILKKPEPGSDFIKLLFVFAAECEEWMKQHRGSENEEKLLELYFEVLSFLKIFELYDERYITLIETDGTEVIVRLFCLDPSKLLGEKDVPGQGLRPVFGDPDTIGVFPQRARRGPGLVGQRARRPSRVRTSAF